LVKSLKEKPMRKHLALGLLVAVMGVEYGWGQSFLADQVHLVQPGLTASVIQDFSLDGGNGFFFPYATGATVYTGSGSDALGNFYQIVRASVPADSPLCDYVSGTAGISRLYDIERITPTGVELVAEVPDCIFTPGTETAPYQLTELRNLAVDSLHGEVYIAVWSRLHYPSGTSSPPDATGIVRISGLTTIHDVIPEGPPGPTGPPGTPADMSRVFALEQQVTALQTQVYMLRQALDRVLALPGINQRLAKPQPQRQVEK
jgi:hypothetical protein